MELLGLALIALLLAALILPWVNLVKHSNRKTEIRELRDDLARQRLELDRLRRARSAEEPSVKRETVEPQEPAASPAPEVAKVAELRAPVVETKRAPEEAPAKPAEIKPMPTVVQLDSDSVAETSELTEPGVQTDWFSKVAVWVGGVALLMAGFYMIKYSIESGWMTQAVRLWLTTIFGFVLCVSGYVVSVRTKLTANERIGQALSGAGVACLYFAAYAAVHLYGFISSTAGFGCMVLVTVAAVFLSLRNGPPIALMGMLGGFLTPLLMQTDSADTAMLFAYLFVLLGGAQVLCVRRGWWSLFLGALVGAYLWSGSLIIAYACGGLSDLEGAMLFVLAVCAANAFLGLGLSERELSQGSRALLSVVRGIVWIGGLAQSVLLAWVVEFTAIDLSLFSVLALGALFLSVYREKEFLWAGWSGFLAVVVATLLNPNLQFASWFVPPIGLLVLFAVVAHWRGLRSTELVVWRSLSMAALLAIAPALYLNREIFVGVGVRYEVFWLLLALGSASLLALSGEHLLRRGEHGDGAVCQSFAVFLVGFGLWEFVEPLYLAHCMAGLLALSAFYWKVRNLSTDRLTLGTVAAAWSLLMWNWAGEAGAYFFAEPFDYPIAQDGVSVLAWLVGVVTAYLIVYLYRHVWSETVQRVMGWWTAVVSILAVVAAYQWFDEYVLGGLYNRSVMEGGLTAIFALLAVVARLLVRRWPLGRVAAVVLAGLTIPRLLFLHLADAGAAGESFFFNALFLQFGLPFIAAVVLAYLSASDEQLGLRHTYQLAAMVLGFVWASFLVQDYYGGERLFGGANTNTELYTYSVVWLSLAIVYQVIGLLRDQRWIHVGSLILLLITVGKVFLVDASELEGLYRVLSFLGLGVALIGIGFFYNKVVFGRRDASAN